VSEEKKPEQPAQMDRRELMRKGVKAAYVVPAVMAVVKASVRPAYAAPGAPVPMAPMAPISHSQNNDDQGQNNQGKKQNQQ
jgi:hypothetical protein